MSTTKTVAGLPQYMTLRATDMERRPLHFLWFDETYAPFHKHMGVKQVVDEVSPFAKIEVVPSTTDPSSYIHLRSSFNGKFCHLADTTSGYFYLSATADSPEEDLYKASCTLFKPVFPPDQPNIVYFLYVPNKNYMFIMNNKHLPGYQVACVVDQEFQTLFEFAPWESYEDRMKGKDEEIEKLEGEVGAEEEEVKKLKAEVGAKDGEIEKLKVEVGAKGGEIEKLKGEVGAKDEEIEKLKSKVEGLEAYEEEWKAKLGEEIRKLQANTTSALKAFEENVMVDPPLQFN